MINTSTLPQLEQISKEHCVFVGREWGKVQFESKLHCMSQEQTSQAMNSKKTCEHYILHQTGMKFILVSHGPSSICRRPSVHLSVVCRPPFSKISKTAGPIKAKFHMEPQSDGGRKVCSWGLGHITKMAATPIYGRNPSKIFFSRTKGPVTLWLGM